MCKLNVLCGRIPCVVLAPKDNLFDVMTSSYECSLTGGECSPTCGECSLTGSRCSLTDGECSLTGSKCSLPCGECSLAGGECSLCGLGTKGGVHQRSFGVRGQLLRRGDLLLRVHVRGRQAEGDRRDLQGAQAGRHAGGHLLAHAASSAGACPQKLRQSLLL